MDVVYDWKIESIEYIPIIGDFNEFILSISAIYLGSFNGVNIKEDISIRFTPESHEGEFISLENILADKSIVIGWLEASTDMDAIREGISSKIFQYLNPPTVRLGFPYSE